MCFFPTILKKHLNPISNYHAKFQAGTFKNSIEIKIYKYLGRFLEILVGYKNESEYYCHKYLY